jgi:peptide/nickel transport system permease protein
MIAAMKARLGTIPLALLKRLLYALPVVWAVVTLVFLLIHIVPGDPVRNALGDNATAEQVTELKRQLGLDLPLGRQYLNYWAGLVKGDLGVSLINPSDRVFEKIIARYPATLELALAGLLVAVSLAVPLGVTAGRYQGRLLDNVVSVVALLGISLPGFVLGPLMILVFASSSTGFPLPGGMARRISFFRQLLWVRPWPRC